MASVDVLVDRLVEHVNRHGQLESCPADEVPASLRIGGPDQYGNYAWKIQRVERAGWIEDLEAALPQRFPPSFRSLITRYAFLPFEAGPLWFFANTGQDVYYELRTSIFKDEFLSGHLLKGGYLQFGRPQEETQYDPACFDMTKRDKSGEAPIVQIDHEGILCDSKVIVVQQIAPSFPAFIDAFLRPA